MMVNGDRIRVFAERDPAKLPWGDVGVEYVLECTGLFTTKAKAGAHLKGGAKKVVISAPGGEDVDATIVYGVNHQTLKSGYTVISNASCTTNCLAPVAKVLHDKVGIAAGIMTTIHSYTNDQVLTDVYHADLRRARSATMSQIPTKTGAAAAVGLVLPELKGKLDGFAVRVPTINVSLVDLTFSARRATSVEEVNQALQAGRRSGPLQGDPRVQRCAAGVDRLQRRCALLDLRRHAHQGSRRHDGQGVRLVRQRVGLLQSHDRHHAGVVAGPMTLLRMTDTDLRNKRVLIREDLNVPVQDGIVTSDARIRAALATIRYALDQHARVFILSHLGRPKEGQADPALTLAPVAARLSELLGKPVPLRRDWLDGVDCAAGSAVLCENVRFVPGEKQDDPQLARRLAALCDVFVMDAFGTAHRAEASTHGVARFAPVACAGPLLVGELEALERALKKPARPLMAIVGGSKVSTKLTVLEALLERVDQLIVGGGIANTFLAATGIDVGKSLCEMEMLDVARRLMDKARARGAEIPLPTRCGGGAGIRRHRARRRTPGARSAAG